MPWKDVNKLCVVFFSIFVLVVSCLVTFKMLYGFLIPATYLASAVGLAYGHAQGDADTRPTAWHPPKKTEVNDLHSAIHAKGVYGFIFNTSHTPSSVPYQTYNWCNMPHVRKQEYVVPSSEYSLEYVEVIHRHHKRTPYASNTFPKEIGTWRCDNTALYYYGAPYPPGTKSAAGFWRYYQSPINPYIPAGFPPYSCAFPQITKEGLEDSFQHGQDLYGVYHDTVHLLPDDALSSGAIKFHVTNNVITSEVAGMLIAGMFGEVTTPVPFYIQQDEVDPLEPTYSCPAANNLYASYGVGSSDPAWTEHLTESQPLFNKLDPISGVDPDDPDWHDSWNNYFDNFSALLCHQKPLPCNDTFSPARCVTQAEADEAFRLGEYEYSYVYRDGGPKSLAASKASYGIWIAQLAEHLRDVSKGKGGGVVYRHNVAHDGSVSRLLSVLQIDKMVWPGMGSEVVFELYRKKSSTDEGEWFVRVLWSGSVLQSSSLGPIDMMPLSQLLYYFDDLVGQSASKVAAECSA